MEYLFPKISIMPMAQVPRGTCAPNQHGAQHMACSTLPSAKPKVPSTSEEAADAEADLNPAWHPKCPPKSCTPRLCIWQNRGQWVLWAP